MATRKRKPRHKRTTRKNSQPRSSLWWRLSKPALYAGLFVSLGVVGYLVYLDRTITKTFEGRRWSVPAQVFAQPLELSDQGNCIVLRPRSRQ